MTWNDFLYDHAEPLKTPTKKRKLSTRKSKGPNFVDIVMRFDCLKYYREVGKRKFPTITMLAKVYFCGMSTSAFQERVFSNAAHVMGKRQASMDLSHFKMKTLLFANADLIRSKII